MNTTIESSAPHIQAIGYLPVETQCWLFSLDDERRQALAALAKQRKAQAANGKHAGAVRSATKRAAIRAMAEDHLPQLRVLAGNKHSRAVFLQNQIQAAIEKDHEYMGLKTPPGWRTIDDELETMSF